MLIEEKLQAASENLDIPGAVVVASDKTGTSPLLNLSKPCSKTPTESFYYSKAFGVGSLKEPSSSKLLKPDSTFWLASCTKLMTAIAALQCVEREQFTLDDCYEIVA
jgi:CubicO group peptidase (beta-lactamase class C family)